MPRKARLDDGQSKVKLVMNVDKALRDRLARMSLETEKYMQDIVIRALRVELDKWEGRRPHE